VSFSTISLFQNYHFCKNRWRNSQKITIILLPRLYHIVYMLLGCPQNLRKIDHIWNQILAKEFFGPKTGSKNRTKHRHFNFGPKFVITGNFWLFFPNLLVFLPKFLFFPTFFLFKNLRNDNFWENMLFVFWRKFYFWPKMVIFHISIFCMGKVYQLIGLIEMRTFVNFEIS